MAKSKSVRKKVQQKRKNDITGDVRHKRIMRKTMMKKFKRKLDEFMRQQEMIRKHKENTLEAAADSVYGNMTE